MASKRDTMMHNLVFLISALFWEVALCQDSTKVPASQIMNIVSKARTADDVYLKKSGDTLYYSIPLPSSLGGLSSVVLRCCSLSTHLRGHIHGDSAKLMEALNAIDAFVNGSSDDLRAELTGRLATERRRQLIDKGAASLKAAVNAYAASIGASKVQEGETPSDRLKDSVSERALFAVSFTTSPPNGVVRYISALDYQILKLFEREHDLAKWTEIRSQRTRMVGSYFFGVRWPNESRPAYFSPSEVNINGNTEIKLP